MPREPMRRTLTPRHSTIYDRPAPIPVEKNGGTVQTDDTIDPLQHGEGERSPQASGLDAPAGGVGQAAAPQVTLSKDQQLILEAVLRGENVFFTGPAGTGKSVLLKAIVSKLVKRRGSEAVAVTSTTGIAALAIGGMTIHSYTGVRTGDKDAKLLSREIKRMTKYSERWKKMEVLLVDEVSMLSPDLFNKLEFIARDVRDTYTWFGGIQLVLTGDFFQLPPVNNATNSVDHPGFEPSQSTQAREELIQYVFDSQVWKESNLRTYFLEEVFRQRDTEFIDILSSMRIGQLKEHQIARLYQLERPLLCGVDGIEPALLLSSNEQVNLQNELRLQRLSGELETFRCVDRAGWDVFRNRLPSDKAMKILRKNTIAPEELNLKLGAQVMLIKNIVQGELVNGSIGKVIDFMTVAEAEKANIEVSSPISDEAGTGVPVDDNQEHDENSSQPQKHRPKYRHRSYFNTLVLKHYECDPTIARRRTELRDITDRIFIPQKDRYPVVMFTNGRKLLCAPMFFERIGLMGNIEACRIQVPLILSWAITIHKSQGQTLNFVKVDFNRIFADGQAYVAVSRATSMEGLQLANFHPSKVHASKKVIEWHDKCYKRWEEQRRCLDSNDDAIFDEYNVDIPESLLEELELHEQVVSDTSWMHEEF